MDKCPFCGDTWGLYSIHTTKFEQYYNFKGEGTGHSEPDDVTKRKSLPLYCMNCNKKITTFEKLILSENKE